MILLNLSLLISMPLGIRMHTLDRKYDFSGAKRMAQFIISNGLDKYPIAAHRYAHLSSIAPYFPNKRFWYAGIGKYATYIKQNQAHVIGHKMPYPEALARIDKAFPNPSSVLILLDAPIDLSGSKKYTFLYKVDSTVFGSDERFYLYLLNYPSER